MSKEVKTLADFKAAHDRSVIVPNKIRVALAAMLKEGPEQYEYETDFIKRAAISQADMGEFRDQFVKYIVMTAAVHGRAGRRVWFADPKVARLARGGDP